MKRLIENLEGQLAEVKDEHSDEVDKGTYWGGVTIGLETAINLMKGRSEKITNDTSEKVTVFIPIVSGIAYCGKNSFALVEHINNDTDKKEYGDVIGETQDYFLVKPHLRKEQNRWLKVGCKIIEYYR